MPTSKSFLLLFSKNKTFIFLAPKLIVSARVRACAGKRG
jgi:hypothetical protein